MIPEILSLSTQGDNMYNPYYYTTSALLAAIAFSVVLSFINGRKK
jgi:hypothetical protein